MRIADGDNLYNTLLTCPYPNCGERQHTYPTERVPEQGLRTGEICGHDFFYGETIEAESLGT